MQRYFSQEKIDNTLVLNENDLHHITRVMRMKDGDTIEVVYDSNEYICKIDVNKLPVVSIIKTNEKHNISKHKIVLIIPLLKEQKMDLILQKSTELGVDEIIPVIMERSIIRLDKSKEASKIDRWLRICKEASEQSKRTTIPLISEVKHLKELGHLDGIKLVCSTVEKENNLKKFLTVNRNYDRINIVVGPEGGISPNEEQTLVDIGFNRVSLGNRIMRVETVPLFILSALNYENME